MVSSIQFHTGLSNVLVDIVNNYLDDDYIIEKVRRTVKGYFLKWDIPFICETAQRNYKIKVTSDFLESLWNENVSSAFKALRSGASYFLSKAVILQLAKNKKYVALNIFTSQISFIRKTYQIF